MELLLKARQELIALRDRFYALVEPEKAIAEKIEEIVHHAVVEIETLGARIGNFESRVAALEKSIEDHVHEELVKLGLAQPKPPTDPEPPMPAVESNAEPTPIPAAPVAEPAPAVAAVDGGDAAEVEVTDPPPLATGAT